MADLKLTEQVNSSITFQGGDHWIMRLTDRGILFNREAYPDASPDDFAKAVIDILERNYGVTFTRKEPPYNRE